jgi:hypothetical protein
VTPNTRENTAVDDSIRLNQPLFERVLRASDLFWKMYIPNSAAAQPAEPKLSWKLEPQVGSVSVVVSERDEMGDRNIPHEFSQEDMFDERARNVGTLRMWSELLDLRSLQRKPRIDELIRELEEEQAAVQQAR